MEPPVMEAHYHLWKPFLKRKNYHLWKPFLKNKACLSKINSVGAFGA
jgi:hypothetical protein